MMVEPSDPVFALFHRYNKLVRRGLAKPLICNTCEGALITFADANDELILKCLACDSAITPGLGRISDVRAVVMEHFVD